MVDYLQAGDVLVINDTKVIKARLITHKPSGGERELVLGMADATAAHEVRVIATLAQRLHTTLALDDVQVP